MKYNAEQVAFMLAEAIDQNREYKSWHVSTQHLMTLVERVVAEEREACAKVCDLALFQCQETMNELDATEHIAQCIVQGAMNQSVKLSKAIRARGQA